MIWNSKLVSVIIAFIFCSMLSPLKWFPSDLMQEVQGLWQCWLHLQKSHVLNLVGAACVCSGSVMMSSYLLSFSSKLSFRKQKIHIGNCGSL